MNKKLLLFFLVFSILTISMGIYFILNNNSKTKINTVENNLNLNYKPTIIEKLSSNKETYGILPNTPLERYDIIVKVEPMIIIYDFFAFATTVYGENKENISAVDTNIDRNNNIIYIIVYINTNYINTDNEINDEVNRYTITGLLYAQSQLKNEKISTELRKSIITKSNDIYRQLRSSNLLPISYK